MAESLTEAVRRAVALAGTLPHLIGDWPQPWSDTATAMLRDSLGAIDRWLTASNSLVERAEEFQGLYPMPPDPVAGESCPSYHQLGRGLALSIWHGVLMASGHEFDDRFDFERVIAHLPMVREYLRTTAPRFDWKRLDTMIVDEAAKARQRAGMKGQPDTLGGPGTANTTPSSPVQWSEPDTPQRWGTVFSISATTFKRMAKKGTIRAKKLSDRRYQVAVEDIPTAPEVSASHHR